MLWRIHAIGATQTFKHRNQLNVKRFGKLSAQLISEYFIPSDLKPAYDSLTQDVLQLVEQQISQIDTSTYIRVHGDCHSGNILWRDNAPHFVDLDDTITAPAVQDIWMLLSGDKKEQKKLLGYVLKGYLEFCDFNPRELVLIEALRTLRIMNFSAWIAKRWEDPAFPMHFPWFNTGRYWSDHILTLRE